MTVQYIGSVEQEAGIFEGAHVYETEPVKISQEIIENGYYVTRGRPREGMR